LHVAISFKKGFDMASNRTQDFIDHIARELDLGEEDLPALTSSWGRVGTTLGALCLKMNLMDMEQINNLLEVQDQTEGLFGDVAQELGYLDEAQVKKLLNIQKWNRRTEVLDKLLLAGKIDEAKLKELSAKIFEI
tara:strand:+ start:59662 stop:60066 length:405 start_codon:yes stop_codon:yes gene_type:complete